MSSIDENWTYQSIGKKPASGVYQHVNPTCRFSLLTDMSNTDEYWTLSLSDHFWEINFIPVKEKLQNQASNRI